MQKSPMFDFDDILIQCATHTQIDSRKQVSPYHKNEFLPLFVSPMDTVIDENNYLTFLENNLHVCLPRKTKITDAVLNYNVEETIQKESVVINITNQGYIKRGPLSSLKAQKRGGKGKTGISTREDDFVVQIFTANTHTPVLFFSTQVLVYKIKAHKIT